MLNVQEELDKFKNYVIQQSKSNLSKLKKNDTKGLYNAIKGEAKAMPNSFYLAFDLGKYGAYVDQGVRGKNSSVALLRSLHQTHIDLSLIDCSQYPVVGF